MHRMVAMETCGVLAYYLTVGVEGCLPCLGG